MAGDDEASVCASDCMAFRRSGLAVMHRKIKRTARQIIMNSN